MKKPKTAEERRDERIAWWEARLAGLPVPVGGENNQVPEPKSPIPNLMANIPPDATALCRACHEAKGCPNIGCIGCGGRIVVNIVVPCPKDYWGEIKELTIAN